MDRRKFLKLTCGLLGAAFLTGCSSQQNFEEVRDFTLKKPPPSFEKKRAKAAVVNGGADIPLALTEALENIGGIERFVQPGDRVLIKPNLVTGRPPEYAVNTNPELVAEMVRLCLYQGAREVIVTDRPTTDARTAFEVSGIADAVRKAGGKLKYPIETDFVRARIPDGKVLKEALILKDVFEVDVIINMPIAKHHSLAGLTLSIKNLMGVLGGRRSSLHINFHEKIVDLYSLVRPHLNILDGWRILIRNGPTGGSLDDVVEKKTIIAGADAVLVDSLAAFELFGKDPRDIEYLVNAAERGLGVLTELD